MEYRSHNTFLYEGRSLSRRDKKPTGTGWMVGIIFLLAFIALAAMQSCKNAEYVVKGKDVVVPYTASAQTAKKVYPGDDVYQDKMVSDTIKQKKPCDCENEKKSPSAHNYHSGAPNANWNFGVTMGHTVLSGYAVIEHETYAYAMHKCQLMRPLGKTAAGEVVWRTACGGDYPNEYYTPLNQLNNR